MLKKRKKHLYPSCLNFPVFQEEKTHEISNRMSIFIFVFLSLFISFQSQAFGKQDCLTLFHKESGHSLNQNKPTLWENSFGLAQHLPLFRTALEVRQRPRLTKQQKQQAEKDFALAFKRRESITMASLIAEFPFLKKIRFTDPSILEQIPENHRHWCPRGWSPTQIASYTKDLDLLHFMLALKMDIRTLKEAGALSVENNPLHIAIKVGFKEGAKMILEFVGKTPFGTRNRFIDEKDQLKQTPWYMAINKDMELRRISYISVVGNYGPSAHVSSYTSRGPRDGYEVAIDTEIPEIISRTHYLKAHNYEHYKGIRRNSPRPDIKRPF